MGIIMETRKIWTQFLPQWVLANMLAWAIFSPIFVILFSPIPIHRFQVRLAGIGAGFLIGYFQWLVLKKHMRLDALWFWASTMTNSLYLMVLIFSGRNAPNFSTFTLLMINIVVISLLSLVQRSVLNYYFNNADIWIVVNTVTGVVAALVVCFGSQIFSIISPFFVWISYGGVYGVITGITLAKLYLSALETFNTQHKQSVSN